MCIYIYIFIYFLIYKEFGLYEFGRWRQPFSLDGEKEQMTQKASVNGSYNHGLAFASNSACFSKHARTIDILLIICW